MTQEILIFTAGVITGAIMAGIVYMIRKAKTDKMPNPNLEATYNDGIITILYSTAPNKQYMGSGTVWRELPLLQRPGTLMEAKLSEIQQYCEHYGNPYPTAHLYKHGDKYNKESLIKDQTN